MADEVDGLPDLLELADEPLDVGLLRRRPSGRRRHAEAGEVGRDHVGPREVRAHFAPEAMRVEDAMDENGGHAERLYRRGRERKAPLLGHDASARMRHWGPEARQATC